MMMMRLYVLSWPLSAVSKAIMIAVPSASARCVSAYSRGSLLLTRRVKGCHLHFIDEEIVTP